MFSLNCMVSVMVSLPNKYFVCLFFSLQGVKIHATVRRTLVYKFQSELKEGSVYSLQFLTVAANVGSYRTCKHEHKLIFQISSKVQIMEVGRVSGDGFDLVPISEIFGGGYDMDYLVGKEHVLSITMLFLRMNVYFSDLFRVYVH